MYLLLGRGGRRLCGTASTLLGLALLGAPSSAHGFCRTTTQPLPASYSPTRGCFTQGLLLYWGGACVGYSIHRDASRNIPFAEAERIIDASFATWMQSTCVKTGGRPGITVSNLGAAECDEVRYNNDTPNQNLIVFRDDSWPYRDPNSTLGLTTVTFNAEDGEIYDADLELNSSGRNLSTSDKVPTNGFDLASVVTHEVGHFLGLAHATDATSTMFASYKPGTAALRSLTADDMAGLCEIYPSATTRVVSARPSSTCTWCQAPAVGNTEVRAADTCDPNPRHGFTTKCTTPKPPVEDGSCAASARPSAPFGASAAIALMVAGLRTVRRRGRASKPR
jgi:hypothetical protein